MFYNYLFKKNIKLPLACEPHKVGGSAARVLGHPLSVGSVIFPVPPPSALTHASLLFTRILSVCTLITDGVFTALTI